MCVKVYSQSDPPRTLSHTMSDKPFTDTDMSHDEKVVLGNEHDEKIVREHDEKIPSSDSRDPESVGRKAVALNLVENPLKVSFWQ